MTAGRSGGGEVTTTDGGEEGHSVSDDFGADGGGEVFGGDEGSLVNEGRAIDNSVGMFDSLDGCD
ncbi:hypothetical protein AGMMS49593_03610 [Endomicrobiia bacterium]|nr:hypothetical protein AGMMS49593_03610 [Endomicrobiia bacterium]